MPPAGIGDCGTAGAKESKEERGFNKCALSPYTPLCTCKGSCGPILHRTIIEQYALPQSYALVQIAMRSIASWKCQEGVNVNWHAPSRL